MELPFTIIDATNIVNRIMLSNHPETIFIYDQDEIIGLFDELDERNELYLFLQDISQMNPTFYDNLSPEFINELIINQDLFIFQLLHSIENYIRHTNSTHLRFALENIYNRLNVIPALSA